MSGSQGLLLEGGLLPLWSDQAESLEEVAYMTMLPKDNPLATPDQEPATMETCQSMSMADLGPALVDPAAIDPALSPWPHMEGAAAGSLPSPDSAHGQHLEAAHEQPAAAEGADATEDEWSYAVKVWPAIENSSCDTRVAQHTAALAEALRYKNVAFALRLERSPQGGLHRLYTLAPRLRDHNRSRLDFLFAFSPNRPFNRALKDYHHTMSVVSFYEPKGLQQADVLYPSSISDGAHQNSPPASTTTSRRGPGALQSGRFSPLQDMHDLEAYNDEPTLLDPSSPPPSIPFLGPPTPEDALPTPPSMPKSRTGSSGSPVPSRMKPIPKPDREVMKSRDGKYRCTTAGCSDEIREFSRKCEWSKHMDKHDRPYICLAEGCEKLPGFTYSGGLLRHEREVHGKHGGPKNPLNCPHVNCKRHDGKGFSRLENLNEHLRRVHTGSPPITPSAEADAIVAEDREDSVSVAGSDKPVRKRKASADDDVQSENKRLRLEVQTYQSTVQKLEEAKQSLEREIAARNQVSMAMMTELRQLRERQPQTQPPQLASFEPGRMRGSAMIGDEANDALLGGPHL
ncbi:zinc finger protein 143/76 [Microdochium nivale]|nr:zinc finger protein 143/76 [Microdochium nivale]